MRTCLLCDREFSTPYCLRRHYRHFHPLENQPQRLRMSRSVHPPYVATNVQTGAGIHPSDEDDEEDINSDSDISNNEEQEEVENEDEEDEDNEDWVFDSLLKETAEELGEDASEKDIRKLFRQKFADSIDWCHSLRRHPIYKKVMETAKDLQEGPGDYDRVEALRAAIKQRKFLLDRLIPSPEPDDDGDDRDEAIDDGDV